MCAREFDEQMTKMIYRYPQQVSEIQMNFLDSHDIPRFLSYCGGDRRKLRLACFYLIMGYGIPSVFMEMNVIWMENRDTVSPGDAMGHIGHLCRGFERVDQLPEDA